ncbi:protein FAM180A [Lampris incognitus]|uniref:protein FAM180A n=1 Tax=Lampris incognitus TaxID=2546036 RepID=UPI0024B4FCED|nr:protein FAM180A [Lampris incognitus]
MDMKLRIQICIQILLGLWFQQVFKVDVAASIYESSASQRIGRSASDASLMFEFLLGGVEIDQDNNILLLDKEMASMRQGRAFTACINDNVAKTLTSMEEMLMTLERNKRKPFSQIQFDGLVLSMVYSAHQAQRKERKEEQLAWGGMLIRLANITVNNLRGQYLITNAQYLN